MTSQGKGRVLQISVIVHRESGLYISLGFKFSCVNVELNPLAMNSQTPATFSGVFIFHCIFIIFR